MNNLTAGCRRGSAFKGSGCTCGGNALHSRRTLKKETGQDHDSLVVKETGRIRGFCCESIRIAVPSSLHKVFAVITGTALCSSVGTPIRNWGLTLLRWCRLLPPSSPASRENTTSVLMSHTSTWTSPGRTLRWPSLLTNTTPRTLKVTRAQPPPDPFPSNCCQFFTQQDKHSIRVRFTQKQLLHQNSIRATVHHVCSQQSFKAFIAHSNLQGKMQVFLPFCDLQIPFF